MSGFESNPHPMAGAESNERAFTRSRTSRRIDYVSPTNGAIRLEIEKDRIHRNVKDWNDRNGQALHEATTGTGRRFFEEYARDSHSTSKVFLTPSCGDETLVTVIWEMDSAEIIEDEWVSGDLCD